MPISVDRERRSNAGSRMDRLLNEEEDEEFYCSAYGGFTEEDEDIDYQSESSVEDIIDSDFADESSGSDDEDRAGGGGRRSDNDDDDEGRKRQRKNRVMTKNYKEPKRSKTTLKSQDAKSTERKLVEKVMGEAMSKSDTQLGDKAASKQTTQSIDQSDCRRPTLRPSTIQATVDQEVELNRRRIQSTTAAVKRKAYLAEIAQRKNLPEVRRLTQEELIAEAKITEEINRRSLARYQRMEIEKKKARIQKTVHSTPMIRCHSFTVPLLDEQPNVYGVSINHAESAVRAGPLITDPSAKCSRNLVTFASDECFRQSMPRSMHPLTNQSGLVNTQLPCKPKCRPRTCPISGLPARYVDPLTLTPFANLAAFRVLRRLFAIHLETNTPPLELLREYRFGK